MEQALACGNCKVLKVDVFETGCCAKLVCTSCASSNSITCPKCHQQIVDKNSLKPNKALSAIIYSIEVTCTCNKRYKVGERAAHEAECPNNLKICPIGCGMNLPLNQIESHLDVCSAAVLTCKDCFQPYQRSLQSVHAAQCTQVLVKCEFAEFGCTEVHPRILIDKHMNESTEKHLLLLADLVKKQKKTIDELAQITACVSGPLSNAHQFCQSNWPQIRQRLEEKSAKFRSKFGNCVDHIKMMHVVVFMVSFLHLMFMPFILKSFILVGTIIAFKRTKNVAGPITSLLCVACAAFLSIMFNCNFFCWSLFIIAGAVVCIRKSRKCRRPELVN